MNSIIIYNYKKCHKIEKFEEILSTHISILKKNNIVQIIEAYFKISKKDGLNIQIKEKSNTYFRINN